MTDTHDAARAALARIGAIMQRDRQAYIDGETIGGDLSTLDQYGSDAVAEYDDAIQDIAAIAALVAELDEKVERAKRALRIVADQATRDEIPGGYRSHVAPEMSDDWHKGYDAAIAAATDALKGGE